MAYPGILNGGRGLRGAEPILTENCAGMNESSPQETFFLAHSVPPTLPYVSFSALSKEEMGPIPPFIRHGRPVSW